MRNALISLGAISALFVFNLKIFTILTFSVISKLKKECENKLKKWTNNLWLTKRVCEEKMSLRLFLSLNFRHLRSKSDF